MALLRQMRSGILQLRQTRYARQGGEGTPTVFMCYGVNVWCVRESPDLFSVGMCMSQIRSGMLPIFMCY